LEIWVNELIEMGTFVSLYKKLKNGQFSIADSLIKINRRNVQAYIMRADAYVKLGIYYQAIKDYSRALRLDKNNAILFYKRGMCKEDLMDSKGAIKDFKRALELKPDYALAYCGRALASSSFARENNLEEMKLVLVDYDKAILLDPKLTNAYIYRGYIKLRLDDKKGACADFSKARELGGRVYDDMCK
jgi:tetratricopeptide (TPR) repeat protein